MPRKIKIIRTATVALSLDVLLKGQLKFLDQYYQVVAVSGLDHHLNKVKNREDVRIIDVEMRRNISPIKDVKSLIQLYRVFKKEKPEIVHSITPKAGLLCMTAAFFANVPLRVHTFTGLLFPYKKGFLKHLLLTMDKILCLFASHIIPEGQGVKTDLLKYNVTSKPLNVIAYGNVNGIDTSNFNPDLFTEKEVFDFKINHKINPKSKVFLFVGRKVKDKGNEELIQAFYQITRQNKNIHLLYVGPYEKQDSLNSKTVETINKLSKENLLTDFGYQADVRIFMKVADVLVLPSYREGFPNVLLQSLAMKTPCIATNISGCNEVIINNMNGFLIDKKNTQELIDSMLKYINNLDLINTHQDNCRGMILEKFSNEIVWNQILDFYNNILSNYELETKR